MQIARVGQRALSAASACVPASASGAYRLEAVSMARIIRHTEADPLQHKLMEAISSRVAPTSTEVIGTAIRAEDLVQPGCAVLLTSGVPFGTPRQYQPDARGVARLKPAPPAPHIRPLPGSSCAASTRR